MHRYDHRRAVREPDAPQLPTPAKRPLHETLSYRAQAQFGHNKCPCCGRGMIRKWKLGAGRPTPPTLATKGHDLPSAVGGTQFILICRQCNNEQGMLTFAQWANVMRRTGDPRLDRVLAVAAFFARETKPWNPECGKPLASLAQMKVALSSRATG